MFVMLNILNSDPLSKFKIHNRTRSKETVFSTGTLISIDILNNYFKLYKMHTRASAGENFTLQYLIW